MHELEVTARISHYMPLGLLQLNFDLELDLINIPTPFALVNYRLLKRPNCHYFDITDHFDSILADALICGQILQMSNVTFEEIFTLRCSTRRKTNWSMISDRLLKWIFHVHSFVTGQQGFWKSWPVRVSSERISDIVHLHTYVKQNSQTIIISERHRRTAKTAKWENHFNRLPHYRRFLWNISTTFT